MSDNDTAPTPEEKPDGDRDLAEHERHERHERPERPEVGLIADEDLPEDLQPTDDNPLAKNPGEESEDDGDAESRKVEGMPDMGDPGAPA
jgi:hypothetical protein